MDKKIKGTTDHLDVNPDVLHFVEGLKSKSEEVREATVKDLKKYVTRELPEKNPDESSAFADAISRCISDLIFSSDPNDRKCGLCAIIILVPTEIKNKVGITSRFGNYLRNIVSTDVEVMELTAHAIGKVARELSAETADNYVEAEVNRSLESLSAHKNEGKKQAALLILRELAIMTPSSFYKQASSFFEQIWEAIRHPSPIIREAAVSTLRATLAITVSREGKEASASLAYYQLCLKEAMQGFEEEASGSTNGTSGGRTSHREERIHGSLLVINELLRICGSRGEGTRQEVEESPDLQWHTPQSSSWSTSSSTSRFQALKSIVKGVPSSLRAVGHLHHSHHHNYHHHHTHPGHGLRGLTELVRHHREQGVAPGFSLLATKVAPVKSPLCLKMMTSKYPEICATIMNMRDYPFKTPVVIHAVMLVLPRMASFGLLEKSSFGISNVDQRKSSFGVSATSSVSSSHEVQEEVKEKPSFFVQNHLDRSMKYLLHKCQDEKTRCQAFTCIGLLAAAVGNYIKPFLADTFKMIKATLVQGRATRRPLSSPNPEPAVFTCISLLSFAVGGDIKEDVSSLLEVIMSTGLSPTLTSSLRDLSRNIPELREEIQSGLLKMLEKVLLPNGTPGAPVTDHSSSSDIRITVLALEVLGKFDFSGKPITPFPLRTTAERFIHPDTNPKEVKLAAVKTCSHLISQALSRPTQDRGPGFPMGPLSPTLRKAIQEVLSSLLHVAETDLEPSVRYSVLSRMEERFDPFLAQQDNLLKLFKLVNDEVFEIRELALCILGRVSKHNPACVLPKLRVYLYQFLTDIQVSGVARNKERAAKLLGHIISTAPLLVRPYTQSVIETFIGQLKENSQIPSVTTSILAAVGAHAQVSGPGLIKWVDQLFPPILENIQDSSSLAKREVGLWTLGELVCCTGYVVEPYRKYPNLMDVLFSFMKAEHAPHIKREVIRDLGFLGAVDPYRHKVNLGVIDAEGDGDSLVAVSESVTDNPEPTASELLVSLPGGHDDFYVAIAIATLMKVMRDPALSQHHMNAVQVCLILVGIMVF